MLGFGNWFRPYAGFTGFYAMMSWLYAGFMVFMLCLMVWTVGIFVVLA